MSEPLDAVFDQSRAVLASFTEKGLVALKDEPGSYQVGMKGNFLFGKRKMDNLFVAAVVKNKGAVVFHFMPVYMNEKLKGDLSPLLVSKLKGKACFHLKTWDGEIEAAIRDALPRGIDSFEIYREKI
jgi:hypothetical protein